jgi:hypothetical protein
MSWRELITGIYEIRPPQLGIPFKPEFYPAASVANVADAEAILNATLPASLRSLLLETNGVKETTAIDGAHGGEWFVPGSLLWTIEDIVEVNRAYRAETEEGKHDREFRSVVFFAPAEVDGVLFAFPVEDGVCVPRVVVWHPIMDELDEVAPSLEDFLRGWLTGTITV